MEIYSIGDFAKRLGVTPDFLKYCENHGIISAEVAENGYRSYDFRQASSVFEYLKQRGVEPRRFLRADFRPYCVKVLENTASILCGLFLVWTKISSAKTASHLTARYF